MLTVEIKQHSIANYQKNRREQYISINGIDDKNAHYSATVFPAVHLYEPTAIAALLDASFTAIAPFLHRVSIHKTVSWWEDQLDIAIYCNTTYDDDAPQIRINLNIQNWEYWNKPWSMLDVATTFSNCITENHYNTVEYWQADEDSMLNGFGLTYQPPNPDVAVYPEIDKLLALLENIMEQTNYYLLAAIDNHALISYFRFPENIKTACKQYLIYFSRFLTDMGISVHTEIKDEIYQTLFKVIPQQGNDDLDKIKEALDLYLSLPGNSSFLAQAAHYHDPAVKDLEDNIRYLQRQLTASEFLLRLQEDKIEMLNLLNYQNKLLREIDQYPQDRETMMWQAGFPGKKQEGSSLHIDFGGVLRLLKRKFNQ
ncbi:hypothetical protein [Chitinophaga nivalis]|uniref:Uncharacterized protein n=1 Tax=Chitinophaga nivalis TaxID=2991709 RepID=A0ABT3II78_9BACT|nr:hypothetical protein [Chitinophaga nivalis]MCW3466661.1 hypothetical protein [Chitinophaga nivalis]MCW3483648.1 hypothetical protein [Chitinophaga nivalis]